MSFKIMAFNFQKFCKLKKSEGDNRTCDEYMQEFLTWGGFPLVCKQNDENSKLVILSNIFDSVVLKDIVMRNKVASPLALEKVLEYVVEKKHWRLKKKLMYVISDFYILRRTG